MAPPPAPWRPRPCSSGSGSALWSWPPPLCAPRKDPYRNPAIYAEGQVAILETFSPDFLISPFVLASLGEAFGSRVATSLRQPPNVAAFAAESAEAALRLPLPDVDSHPGILYLRESIRLLAGRYAGKVPVIGLLVSPVDLPPLIIGLEAWLEALLFQPEVARALLDRLTPFFATLGRAMLRDGATALDLTSNLANRFIVPERVVETLGRPALKEALAEIPGPVILHHGGCPLLPHLRDFMGHPNVVGYVLDAGEDLGAAVRGLGFGDEIPLDTPPECIEVLTDAVCRAGRTTA